MKYLGVDFGTKRIGLATATDENGIAFPLQTVPGGKGAPARVAAIAHEEGVGEIVVGESKDFSGRDNPVMDAIRAFGERLSRTAGVPVRFHPEFLSSAQAAREQGVGADLDASSAAIILQAYLDSRRP